jgi:hypothetical protein
MVLYYPKDVFAILSTLSRLIAASAVAQVIFLLIRSRPIFFLMSKLSIIDSAKLLKQGKPAKMGLALTLFACSVLPQCVDYAISSWATTLPSVQLILGKELPANYSVHLINPRASNSDVAIPYGLLCPHILSFVQKCDDTTELDVQGIPADVVQSMKLSSFRCPSASNLTELIPVYSPKYKYPDVFCGSDSSSTPVTRLGVAMEYVSFAIMYASGERSTFEVYFPPILADQKAHYAMASLSLKNDIKQAPKLFPSLVFSSGVCQSVSHSYSSVASTFYQQAFHGVNFASGVPTLSSVEHKGRSWYRVHILHNVSLSTTRPEYINGLLSQNISIILTIPGQRHPLGSPVPVVKDVDYALVGVTGNTTHCTMDVLWTDYPTREPLVYPLDAFYYLAESEHKFNRTILPSSSLVAKALTFFGYGSSTGNHNFNNTLYVPLDLTPHILVLLCLLVHVGFFIFGPLSVFDLAMQPVLVALDPKAVVGNTAIDPTRRLVLSIVKEESEQGDVTRVLLRASGDLADSDNSFKSYVEVKKALAATTQKHGRDGQESL